MKEGNENYCQLSGGWGESKTYWSKRRIEITAG